MELNLRIKAFCKLGKYMQDYLEGKKGHPLEFVVKKSTEHNAWFTKQNVDLAISAWAMLLTEKKLNEWVSEYNFTNTSKKILVVMAGNIPMVGFHDFLAVLISGQKFVGKTASDDPILIPHFAQKLIEIEPQFKNYIFFEKGLIKDMDAVIATGSNSSAKYFDFYFSKYPHIIRKNRNSVAIVDENISKADLQKLGTDIFMYYGLGCRNVSKIYFSRGFDTNRFFESIIGFDWVMENNKYCNNYQYNQTIYLMNQVAFLDNNFVILKEDENISSPLGVIFYQYYDSKETLILPQNDIQCVVSSESTAFGAAQFPALNDYADNVDTLAFLSSFNEY